MAIIEFEGFDKKTEKALKKKVAEVVVPMTKDEAIKALNDVGIDYPTAGLTVTDKAIVFYATTADGVCEIQCMAGLDPGDGVTHWQALVEDATRFGSLDALLKAL